MTAEFVHLVLPNMCQILMILAVVVLKVFLIFIILTRILTNLDLEVMEKPCIAIHCPNQQLKILYMNYYQT